MTQSVDQKASAAAAATDAWLSAFQQALTARDADAAAALFAADSYWRDIVAFTWNITTVEGGAGVADLLRATLDEVDPVGFRATEEPIEADGVSTAWVAFETKVGRGSGLLRLIDGKAFTLLTTLDELKGHEEPSNGRRPKGVRHGAFRGRRNRYAPRCVPPSAACSPDAAIRPTSSQPRSTSSCTRPNCSPRLRDK